MKSHRLRSKMAKVYGIWCWMDKEEVADTFHHIVEVRNGGKLIWENGALLSRREHDILNELDVERHWAYNELNRLFKVVNESMQEPLEEHYEEVELVKRLARTWHV